MQEKAGCKRNPLLLLALADDVQHFAVFRHSLDQILLHRHNEYPPIIKNLQIANDSQHLADGSHGLAQVLHHRVFHNI